MAEWEVEDLSQPRASYPKFVAMVGKVILQSVSPLGTVQVIDSLEMEIPFGSWFINRTEIVVGGVEAIE